MTFLIRLLPEVASYKDIDEQARRRVAPLTLTGGAAPLATPIAAAASPGTGGAGAAAGRGCGGTGMGAGGADAAAGVGAAPLLLAGIGLPAGVWGKGRT